MQFVFVESVYQSSTHTLNSVLLFPAPALVIRLERYKYTTERISGFLLS